jgi:hypothetical protein
VGGYWGYSTKQFQIVWVIKAVCVRVSSTPMYIYRNVGGSSMGYKGGRQSKKVNTTDLNITSDNFNYR